MLFLIDWEIIQYDSGGDELDSYLWLWHNAPSCNWLVGFWY